MSKEKPAPSESDTNQSPQRQAWAARNLDATALELLAEDAQYFMRQSVSTPCLNAIVKAEGIFIVDTAGRRYMDFHGNNVHHIGYGHPRLKRAIVEQMDALSFTPRRYTSEPAVALARKLADIAPGNLEQSAVHYRRLRCRRGRHQDRPLCDRPIQDAVILGRISWRRLWRGGGRRRGAVSLRAHRPAHAGAEHVAPFSSYRCPYGTSSAEESGAACARMIDYVLGREGDVAAFIAEPIRAVPYLPPPGFWKEVRRICDRHGTLLVFDEIPMGLGKSGKMFACEHDGVVPDIMVLGKALGGGILPIAAVIARPNSMSAPIMRSATIRTRKIRSPRGRR